MPELSGIGLLSAFLAGTISFLSPCVLPLVPGYVSYVAGTSSQQEPGGNREIVGSNAVVMSLWFVLGFSTVFMALGASATALGQFLLAYKEDLNLVGGGLVLLFGLFMLGLANIPVMQRDFRFHIDLPGGRPASAYVLGLAFGFGWTPCIGPILGAILTASAATATVTEGVLLLAIYSAGLGVPFVLAARFTDQLSQRLRGLRNAGRLLHTAAGGVLILMGIAMMTGQLSAFSYWLLDMFPVLGRIG